MVIQIDRSLDEPAYEQAARQIRDAIATGAFKPHDLLPGVRGLASDLGVNLNTVARAYRLLEDQGFVQIRDRSGVEVAEPARRAPAEASAAFRDELWQVLLRMRQAGMPPAGIRREIDRQLDKLFTPAGESER
ncbi:MAG: GntR family transcriptional regulator [Acidobacteria bacterium]|nr:GntR family transcriptional regulator [Acidobacteriota bacterium]